MFFIACGRQTGSAKCPTYRILAVKELKEIIKHQFLYNRNSLLYFFQLGNIFTYGFINWCNSFRSNTYKNIQVMGLFQEILFKKYNIKYNTTGLHFNSTSTWYNFLDTLFHLLVHDFLWLWNHASKYCIMFAYSPKYVTDNIIVST